MAPALVADQLLLASHGLNVGARVKRKKTRFLVGFYLVYGVGLGML